MNEEQGAMWSFQFSTITNLSPHQISRIHWGSTIHPVITKDANQFHGMTKCLLPQRFHPTSASGAGIQSLRSFIVPFDQADSVILQTKVFHHPRMGQLWMGLLLYSPSRQLCQLACIVISTVRFLGFFL